MKPLHRWAVSVAALSLLAVLAAPSHAGWGDALKQKASKVLKTEKPKPAAETATGPVKSRMTPEVTVESLTRFQKGMEVELAEREKAKKLLASLPPKEQRDKCAQQVAMSKDAEKIAMEWSESAANAKPEEMQQHMARMTARMDSMVTHKCGLDPLKYDAHQLARDAVAKGSDTAALGDDVAYFTWKEWAIQFCNYIEKLQKQPDAKEQLAKIKAEGLRIPGSGNVYFVYSASEANLLLERCAALKPLIEATL